MRIQIFTEAATGSRRRRITASLLCLDVVLSPVPSALLLIREQARQHDSRDGLNVWQPWAWWACCCSRHPTPSPGRPFTWSFPSQPVSRLDVRFWVLRVRHVILLCPSDSDVLLRYLAHLSSLRIIVSNQCFQ